MCPFQAGHEGLEARGFGDGHQARRFATPKMSAFAHIGMARKPANGDTQPTGYGDAVQQLEQLVTGLESGQMPLEELLTQYQRGTELLRYCRDRLQAIEDQVKVLDDAGALKPWALE